MMTRSTQAFFDENNKMHALLRAAGFVDSGLSSSRGMNFVSSYQPNAKLRRKGFTGSVEIFTSPGDKREIYYHLSYKNEVRTGRRDMTSDELAKIIKLM